MMRRGAWVFAIATAIAAWAIVDAWSVCPSGGGGGGGGGNAPAKTRGGDEAQAWEAWWQAPRELYYAIPRPRPASDAKLQGSQNVDYGDPLRVKVLAALEKCATGDENRNVRLQAVLALGKAGGEAQRATILAVNEKDAAREVRITSVIALGLLGLEPSVPFLSQRFEDPAGDEVVRHYAAIGLGCTGLSSQIAPLARAINQGDENRGVQLGALIGLARITDVRSLAVAGDVLADPARHKLLRALAAFTLSRQDPVLAVPELGRALGQDNPDPVVEQAVALALGHAKSPVAVKLLDRMISETPDALARAFALMSLARQRDANQAARIAAMLEEFQPKIRAFAALACGIQGDAAAIPALRRYCDRYDGDPSNLGAGLIALAMLRDDTLLDRQLSASAWDQHKRDARWVRSAVTATGLLGLDRGVDRMVPVWLDQLRDVDIAAWGVIALRMCGRTDVLAKLVPYIETGKSYEQDAAILALGEGDPRAVGEALIGYMAKAPTQEVRGGAAQSLGNLFDRSPQYGNLRELSFAYSFFVSDLDRSLRHTFALP